MPNSKFIPRRFTVSVIERLTNKYAKFAEYTWGEFLEELNTPRLIKLPPQDPYESDEFYTKRIGKLKDIGGYIGGKLINRERKSGVEFRSLITLDADKADENFLPMVQKFDFAYALHTTFNHTPDTPRYRVVIPLDRDISANDYSVLARAVMQKIGKHYFDPTCDQSNRIMFFPGVSLQNEPWFYFETSDEKPYIEIDTWTRFYDGSLWDKRIKNTVAKTNNQELVPYTVNLDKPGIVEAFNRAYTVTHAIDKFLPDIYERESDERYISKESESGISGLVILDNNTKAYSHHAKDKAIMGNYAYSAFDLVRVHKFEPIFDVDLPRDETNQIITPMTKRPSYQNLQEYAHQDELVKGELAKMADEMNALLGNNQAIQVIDTLTTKEGEVESLELDQFIIEKTNTDKVRAKLEYSALGFILPTSYNFVQILENDPRLAGLFQLNMFVEKYEFARAPWYAPDIEPGDYYTERRHGDIIQNYIQRAYQIRHERCFTSAVEEVFWAHRYHPILDFLQSLRLPDETIQVIKKHEIQKGNDDYQILKNIPLDENQRYITTIWDGTPRLERVIIDTLGAVDTPLVRVQTRKWFIGAVARMLEPGCAMDSILVLVGKEEAGKSLFLSFVAGTESYGKESPYYQVLSAEDFTSKDSLELLKGCWVCEFGELASFQARHITAEQANNFLTKKTDKYRSAYEKRPEIHPRCCVLAGTSNDIEFLRQELAGRRFWVIPVGVGWASHMFTFKSVNERLKNIQGENRRQVFAEALHYYLQGEKPMLDEAYSQESKENAKNYIIGNEFYDMLENYLDTPVPGKDDKIWYSEFTIYQRSAIVSGNTVAANLGIDYNAMFHHIRQDIASTVIKEELFPNDIGRGRAKVDSQINYYFNNSPFWEKSSGRDRKSYGNHRSFKYFTRKDKVEIDGMHHQRATNLTNLVGFYL